MRRTARRLLESSGAAAAAQHLQTDVEFENAVERWGRCAFPELSVVIANLRAVSMLHQVHHWQSRGDPFYGDHQLFQRLYAGISDEIDRVAERAVSVGGPENVDLQGQLMHTLKIVESLGCCGVIPSQVELVRRSLAAELNFIRCLDLTAASMRDSGTLTRGIDNLLSGIEDAHESNVYLLKQRAAREC